MHLLLIFQSCDKSGKDNPIHFLIDFALGWLTGDAPQSVFLHYSL